MLFRFLEKKPPVPSFSKLAEICKFTVARHSQIHAQTPIVFITNLMSSFSLQPKECYGHYFYVLLFQYSVYCFINLSHKLVKLTFD